VGLGLRDRDGAGARRDLVPGAVPLHAFGEPPRGQRGGEQRVGQEEGAKILTGGGRPAGLEKGWYVEPTLFGDVDNAMRIAREEIFGPVVCLLPYGDEDEAVRIADDSEYGLSGSVWTGDVERGIEVARRVRTGTYSVNTFSLDMLGPFGGSKDSGLVREFGPEGFGAYLEHKMIHLPAGGEA